MIIEAKYHKNHVLTQMQLYVDITMSDIMKVLTLQDIMEVLICKMEVLILQDIM